MEFKEFPKIPRLRRDMIVTEKIDGTNAAVIVMPADSRPGNTYPQVGTLVDAASDVGVLYWTPVGKNLPGIMVETDLGLFVVAAQSRKRIISPGKTSDNAGFASWVRENAQELAELLGPGYHYGEWFGSSIQGNKQQVEGKEFRLFNVMRYEAVQDTTIGGIVVGKVPLLFDGPFSEITIAEIVSDLREQGSRVPGHLETPAEGVVIFHKASGDTYKVLCENDDLPKGVTTYQERAVAAEVVA